GRPTQYLYACLDRMGTPTLVCVWSCPNFSAPAGRPFRSSLSQPRPDAIIRSLTPSLDRSRRRRFMPVTPSPRSVNNTSSWIWCSHAPDFSTTCAHIAESRIPANASSGCSYKEFLACNPKEYDGKGGAVVLTHWIEKMENVQDMSGCSNDQKVKYTAGSFVDFMVPLTDEAVRNDKLEVEKRGNVGETSKHKNGRDENKRTRTGNVFATTVNHVGRENMGTWSKCTTCNSYHTPGGPCRTCFNCNRLGHLEKDYRGVPRNVNPINARNPTVRACYECGSTDHVRSACPRLNRVQEPEGNRPNQVAANNGGQGHGNQGNQARGRAIMLGAEEARQDPNIVTGLEPSDLGFRYEIEIASGQLVKIDKVIKG
ncbi:putative reverse transcriptase domain-containing protein, partial [Tanacetum coccineum]